MTNPMPAIARRCLACKAADLQEATSEEHFYPHGKQVTVLLRVSRCPACGMELINAQQRRENLVRLQARKSEYGDLLLGEEIVELRKRYGLTQEMAAKIFGKGKIAFSRYENEASYPDASMTKLLKLAIALPAALKILADNEGLEIPLWEQRRSEWLQQRFMELAAQRSKRTTAVSGTWWAAARIVDEQLRSAASPRTDAMEVEQFVMDRLRDAASQRANVAEAV